MLLLLFIFSDFWIWLGTVVLLALTFGGICDVIKTLKGTEADNERNNHGDETKGEVI